MTETAALAPDLDQTQLYERLLSNMAGLAMDQDQNMPHPSSRCDRCRAQARAEFDLSAGEIALCGHHTRVHLQALSRAGAWPTALDADHLWFLDLRLP